MDKEKKSCSRCKEFKSVVDFYKQGDRFESLCKACKKSSRKNNRENKSSGDWGKIEGQNVGQCSEKSNSNSGGQPITCLNASESLSTASEIYLPPYKRDEMPVFDESIYYPEKKCQELGFESDDIADLVAYFRWQLAQREKRITIKTDEDSDNSESAAQVQTKSA